MALAVFNLDISSAVCMIVVSKMGRKIFTKKNIWKVVSAVAIIILGNVDFYLIRSGVAKGIVNALGWIFNFMNQGVPNFYTNLLLLVALGFLVFLNRKIMRLPPATKKGVEEDVKSLREDFGKHEEIYTKVTKGLEEKIRKLQQELSKVQDKANKYDVLTGFNPECTWILARLGERDEEALPQGALYALYRQNYGFRNNRIATLKFNLRINWLEKNDYIIRRPAPDDDITTYVVITDKGWEHLGIIEAKTEEDRKKREYEEKKKLEAEDKEPL